MISDVQKSKPTIVSYIKDWNKLLLESLKDNRGVSESSFTAETIRRILTSENYTFKRAQEKPSKADKSEQEGFKNEYALIY
ncbi:winged helix-turn-helix domain-containing protein [Clostridium sp. PL3]|uniref:Winged helix-turn-helix domain-containing protein n=1 Tax=Clostridium thailandense TaxID=2794346 RepID=A0A949TFH4_9CLOT|nr:winged helix-turn-helix domain-containing protein [Clostridium thailandense]